MSEWVWFASALRLTADGAGRGLGLGPGLTVGAGRVLIAAPVLKKASSSGPSASTIDRPIDLRSGVRLVRQ